MFSLHFFDRVIQTSSEGSFIMNGKNLIILGLSAVLVTTPVYANTKKSVLTLESATQSALRNNNQLKLNNQERQVLNEKSSDSLTTYASKQLSISKDQNKQNKTFLTDQITFDITKRYNNMYLLACEINNIKSSIRLKETELRQLNTKYDLQLATDLEVQSLELDLLGLEKDLLAAEQNLAIEQLSFKLLTNYNVANYNLENRIALEPFHITGNVETYFKKKVETYLQYQIESAEYQQEHFKSTLPYNYSDAEYKEAEYNSDSAVLNLKDSSVSMVQTLANNYASLLSLEEQIATLNAQYAFANNQLEILLLQQELGLITAFTCQSQIQGINELEYTLLSLINNYMNIAEILQKPWLLG